MPSLLLLQKTFAEKQNIMLKIGKKLQKRIKLNEKLIALFSITTKVRFGWFLATVVASVRPHTLRGVGRWNLQASTKLITTLRSPVLKETPCAVSSYQSLKWTAKSALWYHDWWVTHVQLRNCLLQFFLVIINNFLDARHHRLVLLGCCAEYKVFQCTSCF